MHSCLTPEPKNGRSMRQLQHQRLHYCHSEGTGQAEDLLTTEYRPTRNWHIVGAIAASGTPYPDVATVRELVMFDTTR